jgi:uncharacterized surface protein with fasciclin (FAS1) repeats
MIKSVSIALVLSLSAFACGSSSKKMEAPMEAPVAAVDIVDTAIAAGNFTTLVKAIQEAGLVETLKGAGPFTVFAPTDEAFAKLPPGTIEGLLADKAKLTAVLTYHVVSGAVMAADVAALKTAKTVQGAELTIDTSAGVKNQQRHGHHGRHQGLQRRHSRHRHCASTADVVAHDSQRANQDERYPTRQHGNAAEFDLG